MKCFSKVLLGVTLLPCLLSLTSAHAQNYPTKPVRVIMPNNVGTPLDIQTRGVAQRLTQALGQPFVVENRVGANGIVGMEACAKAVPDGYTLCAANNSHISLNPFVYAKLPYDPLRDFAPIVNVGFINGCILSNSSVAANSMRELVELAKSKPGQLNWATWGMGSFAHLTLEWVNANTGARFTHVPYKTPDQALNAVITGEAHVTQNNPLIALPHIKAGKLKALAVAGHKRAASLPGVPAFTEAGYDLDFAGWNGLFAPVGTPRAIVQRLNAEVNAFLADPKFAEQFLTPLSAEAAGGSPEEFAAFLKVDLDTAGKLAKIANLKAQ